MDALPADIRAAAAAALDEYRSDESKLGRDWDQIAARRWLREVLRVDPDRWAVVEDDEFGDVYIVDGLELVFQVRLTDVEKIGLIRACENCTERYLPSQDWITSLADLGRWLETGGLCDDCRQRIHRSA